MQKLEILIEENAFGSVRPVEVVADVPVSALVTALVEELRLPQTDLFGKRLVYTLRRSSDGRVLPENTSLLASSIQPGARLALDSSVADSSMATSTPSRQLPYMADPGLHSSVTIADGDMFTAMGNSVISSGNMPAMRPERKWGRRVFLVMSGAILGAGGLGLGYAAYNSFLSGAFSGLNRMALPPTAPQVQVQKPAKPTTFTMATSQIVFMGHQQLVRTVAWSPDGTMLASGADDARLFVWGTDGAVKQDIKHKASVRAVAWAADGHRLVTGSGTQVAFFNALTGKMLARPIRRHNQAVTSLAWSGQGQMQAVSAGADMRAFVWNTVNYRPLLTYALHNAPIDAVSISADGQTVATASQGGFVRIWQIANGKDLHGYYQDAQAPMQAAAFAPTGLQLAVGGNDGLVRIWNVQTCQTQTNGRCVDAPQRLQVSQQPIHTLAWSPDGRFLAVGAEDGKFSVWNPAQPQNALLGVQQNGIVHSVVWSPDGKHLASASGNTVTIWALA